MVVAAGVPTPAVLVVDDDPDLGEVVCEVLGDGGYAVTRVSSGAEALARLAAGERPAAMIVDFGMPDMIGPEFLRACARVFPEGGRIPALVMSAHDAKEMAEKGVCACLHKPFTAEELMARVQELLSPGSRG